MFAVRLANPQKNHYCRGKTWRLKVFGDPSQSYNWLLAPVDGGRGRRNLGAISQGSFFSAAHGSYTPTSWTGKQSATFSFDGAGELVAKPSGPVTVGGMPHPVNNTNRVPTVQVSPQVRDPTLHALPTARPLILPANDAFVTPSVLRRPHHNARRLTARDGRALYAPGYR